MVVKDRQVRKAGFVIGIVLIIVGVLLPTSTLVDNLWKTSGEIRDQLLVGAFLLKISLIVSEADLGALGFYQACGFDRVGTMKDEISRGTHGVLLSRVTDYELHPNR